jgi:GTP-binding protein
LFVDQVNLQLKSGKGGAGSVSFRREKYIPRGGPDGGDGGRGGHVILKTLINCYSLIDYRHLNQLSAGNGQGGQGRNKSGSEGDDLILILPPGTLIKEAETGEVIVDLAKPGLEFTLLPGGRGGQGNARFKTSTNQTPRFAQPGEPGQALRIILELKLVAGVGLVGLPNAGKSTLISKISNAKPKIADYPFTTLTPNLGVVDFHQQSLVVADIPGLIEGAHQGIGMGTTFLKHIERTELLAFIIDMLPTSGIDPIKQLSILTHELGQYSSTLLRKKKIIVANKVDLLPKGDLSPELNSLKKKSAAMNADFIAISAITGYNLNQFIETMFEKCPKKILQKT